MKINLLGKRLLASALALPLAGAWILDSSCTNLGYGEMVTDGMNNAFALAQSGLDAWKALTSGSYNEAEFNLLKNLYPWAITQVNGQKVANSENENWQYIKTVFELVLARKELETLALPIEIKVFCDFSRYTENKDCEGKDKPGWACDEPVQRVTEMDVSYRSCKSWQASPIQAMTLNILDKPAQIEVCSWYLQQNQKGKEKYLSDLSFAAKGWKKLMDGAIDKFILRAEIDTFALFDHTMLHEMTHGVKLYLNDYDTGSDDSGGSMGSYGWKNCVKLATSTKKNAYKNAETFAYFGLVAHMITHPMDGKDPKDGEVYMTANKQGKIVELKPGSPQLTRNNPATSPQARSLQSVSRELRLPDYNGVRRKDFRRSLRSVSLKPTKSPQSHTTLRKTTPAIPEPSGQKSTHTSSISLGKSAVSTGTTRSGSPSAHHSGKPRTESSSQTGFKPSVTVGLSTSQISTSGVPSTVIPIVSGTSTTEVTYIATRTNIDGGPPTSAWMCSGTLCNTGSDCIIPIVCGDEPGSGLSWGICCGWDPDLSGGSGVSPPAGGPQPGPPEPDDNGSSSDPTSSSQAPSTSTCEPSVASTCAVTISPVRPSRAIVASTVTITGTCSTTTGCGVTDYTTTTTLSSSPASSTRMSSTSLLRPAETVTPIWDYWNWDEDSNWLEYQQSVLMAAESLESVILASSGGISRSSIPFKSSSRVLSTSPLGPRPTPQPTTTIASSTLPSTQTPNPTADLCEVMVDRSQSAVCACSTISSGIAIYTTLPLVSGQCYAHSTFPPVSQTTSIRNPSPSPTLTPTPTVGPCEVMIDRSQDAVCACSTTSSGSALYTTLSLVSGQCYAYRTFPPSTNPFPFTTTSEGTVYAYATSTLSVEDFGATEVTYTLGAGSSTIIRTPTPTPTVPFPFTVTSAGDTVVAYASSTLSYAQYGPDKVTYTVGVGSSTIISTPTPTANCAFWDEYGAYMFVVYDIFHWNAAASDLENNLLGQERGCGVLTGWSFNLSTSNWGAAASFNLPIFLSAGCVESAIESAGGPSGLSCEGMGERIFAPDISVNGVLNYMFG